MSKPIEIGISGIKCDHCDYKDDDVNVDDYAEYVNKPCPECGANLLTEADYETVLMMIATVENLNALGLDDDDDSERVRVEFDMDGSGSLHITDIQEDS